MARKPLPPPHPLKGTPTFTKGLQTWYEYIQSLPPSKMAVFLRRALAHNQGCPPASLMQVFTVCGATGSCDECWWMWLMHPRQDTDEDNPDVQRCWECRWGARFTRNKHPIVGCMNPRFNNAIMDPEDYCSDFVTKYESPEKRMEDIGTEAIIPVTEEDQKVVGEVMKAQYERKQLKREIARRQAEGGNNETTGKYQENHSNAPDPG